MDTEQKTEKTKVIVEMHEFTGYGADCWSHEYEHFVDYLRDRVQTIIDRDVEYIVAVNHCIVGHTDSSVTFELEWYDDTE